MHGGGRVSAGWGSAGGCPRRAGLEAGDADAQVWCGATLSLRGVTGARVSRLCYGDEGCHLTAPGCQSRVHGHVPCRFTGRRSCHTCTV
jgi:hypothetical protein